MQPSLHMSKRAWVIAVLAACAPAPLACGLPPAHARQVAGSPPEGGRSARLIHGRTTPKRHGHRPATHSHARLLRGVNVQPAESIAQDRAELSQVAALRANIVRIEVRWSELESLPGRLSPELLARLDAFMKAAAEKGIKVLAMVEGTPCWDSAAPPQIEAQCVPGRESAANAWPPANDASYGSFVEFLAKRYAAELGAIEVWNEPDQANEDYLAGPEKAAHYAAILKAAYPAIKAVAPQLPVLAGSFIGPNGTFLRLLYEHGIQGYYDGLAVHFYTLTLAALRVIHEVQIKYHDPKPLWLDEFGWPSCWPAQEIEQEQPCVSERVQAENLASMTHELARLPYVAAAVFYKLQDTEGEAFGVLSASGARKPSFAAVARAFAHPLARPVRLRLRLRRAHGRLIALGSAPVGDYLQLEALRRGHLRYSALLTLSRFNRYRVILPAKVGLRGILVRVYQYGYPRGSGAHARG
jgi:hypothetical protein